MCVTLLEECPGAEVRFHARLYRVVGIQSTRACETIARIPLDLFSILYANKLDMTNSSIIAPNVAHTLISGIRSPSDLAVHYPHLHASISLQNPASQVQQHASSLPDLRQSQSISKMPQSLLATQNALRGTHSICRIGHNSSPPRSPATQRSRAAKHVPSATSTQRLLLCVTQRSIAIMVFIV